MIREPKQRIAKQAPSVLGSCGLRSPLEALPSPEAGKVSAEDLQAVLDEIDTMISEGGPTGSTGSVSIHGRLDEGEQLTGMIQELQSNHIALDRLRDWYGVFVFTGGDVPRGRCDLLAIASYLERPFAADRISTGEVERYRHLVEATMEPRQDVAAGPRTLRCRKDLGDAFDRASADIQTLETALEPVLAKLLKELEPPFPAPKMDLKRAKTQLERSREWLE
jgi:hypothetical protein